MCVFYSSRYNTLSNIRVPTAPKHLQEIFWLFSPYQAIRSPERVLNGVALDPFTSDKTNGERDGMANFN